MSETTQIHPDKLRAYEATNYRLGTLIRTLSSPSVSALSAWQRCSLATASTVAHSLRPITRSEPFSRMRPTLRDTRNLPASFKN